MEIGVLGSIAHDNIFTVNQVPVLGERVFGTRLGKYIGGMAANQAFEAARYTEKVFIFGSVGTDLEGKQIIKAFNERGINTNFIQVDSGKATGQTYMYLMNDDYYSIVTPGANLNVSPEEIGRSIKAMGPGFLIISLEINQSAVRSAFNVSSSENIESFLIPSPVKNCIDEYLDLCDSLILNRREFQSLYDIELRNLEDAKKELSKLKGTKKRILITLGKEGAALLNHDRVYLSESIKVKSVDSIGAGDALAGAFVGCLVRGLHPQKALSMGCIAGALVTGRIGPQSSEHTFEDVSKLFNEHYHSKGD